MDLNKLKADLLAKKKSSKTEFSDLIVVYTGAEPKEYYEKLRDSTTGNVIKDEKGNDKRSSSVKGYTHTFNQLGTAKVVKIIMKNRDINAQLLGVYTVSGLGYDIKQSSMIFIDDVKEIKNYA